MEPPGGKVAECGVKTPQRERQCAGHMARGVLRWLADIDDGFTAPVCGAEAVQWFLD
ncbi:hypothetical protein GCM10029992_47500 [Glycomyces albus]